MSDSERQPGNNIAETLFRELRARILRGELPVGARLPGERELAATYDTNRNTLREAFRKLEHARLITVRHGQGVTVADFRQTGTLDLLTPLLEAAPDFGEAVHILEDILPARLLVIELAARVAVRRATEGDIERLASVSALLTDAFTRGDTETLGLSFHTWLDALVAAAHSVAIRWIANPFLEAYREVLSRFPNLWVLEPTFPGHLAEVLAAFGSRDEERAGRSVRSYYETVDAQMLEIVRRVVTGAAEQG